MVLGQQEGSSLDQIQNQAQQEQLLQQQLQQQNQARPQSVRGFFDEMREKGQEFERKSQEDFDRPEREFQTSLINQELKKRGDEAKINSIFSNRPELNVSPETKLDKFKNFLSGSNVKDFLKTGQDKLSLLDGKAKQFNKDITGGGRLVNIPRTVPGVARQFGLLQQQAPRGGLSAKNFGIASVERAFNFNPISDMIGMNKSNRGNFSMFGNSKKGSTPKKIKDLIGF